MSVVVEYDVKMCCLASIESYKLGTERKESLDWQFKYDGQTSSYRIACYIATGGLSRAVIIASRGTVPTDVHDLIADFELAAGQEETSTLLQTQRKVIESLILHYQRQGVPIDNIYLTGHSLGGAFSVYGHGTHPETDCIIFNPGFPTSTLLPKGYSKFKAILDSINIQNFLIKGDPIAMPTIGLVQRQTIIKGNPPPESLIQAHSLAYLNSQLIPETPITNTNPLAMYNQRQRYNF